MMKIGICLIIKDENEYLDEWLTHYRGLGVDKFFIYDNKSEIPVKIDSDDVNVILWDDKKTSTQTKAYLDCCINNKDFDYIGFFDTDEFYMSNSMNIKEDIKILMSIYGEFNGLGLYWRMYGKTEPYFSKRMPINSYDHFFEHTHIKSFINPKSIIVFDNPHYAKINGKYINELGESVTSAIGTHTSKKMWIKHIWTRSLPEFQTKIKRGAADKVIRDRNHQDFIDYNNQCILK